MSEGTAKERHERVRSLFIEALRLPPSERGALLESRARAGDAPVVDDVRVLLEGEEESPEFLATPALASADAAMEVLPSHIGPYRVRAKIGEGGMGAVFEAEQEHPRRVVAVKVLHSQVAGDATRRRFEREARFLARLHHPGIAQIHDAGEADTAFGRQPYIVMERVEGLPITEFARQGDVPTVARLELFARVCDAAQHAHDRGVVHRDLKPANILVERSGQPKILDFGIARLAFGDDPDAESLLTASRSILGTVPYLSPEQASGRAGGIDARADVYSLGVVLYELLTGDLPFDVRSRSVAESIRIVIDKEPTPPASRLRALRGDVETIIGKAMEKEPARRYASAAALASDVRRHLRNEPIEARPASSLYRARKFARRNRALVAGALATFTALAAGAGVALRLALDERAARRLADANAYRSSVLFAASAFAAGDAAAAHAQLVSAPEEHRGWEWFHLQRRLDESLSSFAVAESNCVLMDLAFSADGRRIVVATSAGVRDAEWDSRAPVASLVRPGEAALEASFLTLGFRGETSLSAERTARTLTLRSTESGEVLSTIRGREARTEAAAASPRGNRVAVRGRDDAIELFDTSGAEGRSLGKWRYTGNWRFDLAFSPDGSLLAFGDANGNVLVVNADSGKERSRLRERVSACAIAFHPDGSRLAVGYGEYYASPDGGCAVYGVDGGAAELRIPFHSGPVTALAFSPDGARLAIGTGFGSVHVFDTASGRETATHRSYGSFVRAIDYSPDGRLLAAGTRSGAVHLFLAEASADEAGTLRGHTSYVYGCSVSPDGSTIASSAWDDTVRLWDAASGSAIAVLRGHSRYVKSVEFDPSGTGRVLSASADLTYRLWDSRTGSETARFTEDASNILAAAFTPDGAFLVVATDRSDRRLFTRDSRTSAIGAIASSVPSRPSALAVDPRGKFVATAAFDGALRVYELPSLALRKENTSNPIAISSVSCSSDGARIALTRDDGSIEVRDSTTLELECATRTSGGEAFTARFAPDGARLAAGGRDGVLRLLDASNGEIVANFRAHSDYIYRLAWSPDGKTIVTASGDKTLRLWDSSPLRERLLARRNEERARERVAPIVRALYAECGEATAVVARIGADPALSEEDRAAALREALRQRP